MDATTTTFKDAVCGRKYAKGTWVCFFFNLFNQQSGINAVNIYAGQLLMQMKEQGGDFPITPITGGYLIGAANAFFAIIILFCIERVGRKTIMVAG